MTANDVDFVADALTEVVEWETVVPGGGKLFHATKDLEAVIREGLRPASSLPVDGGAFGHAGYADDKGISLTWSEARAHRYLDYLELLFQAANQRKTVIEIADRQLQLAGVRWSELVPGVLGEERLGSVFWLDEGWLTHDEYWEMQDRPPTDVRTLWWERARSSRISEWDALVLLNGDLAAHRGADASLGVADLLPRFFQITTPRTLGVVAVDLVPRALVASHPEEDEIRVLNPHDIRRLTVVRQVLLQP